MRILLSAYSCVPGSGSEPGIGWNWAAELATVGHDVLLLTRQSNRGPVEEEKSRRGLSNLRGIYVDFPSWAFLLGSGQVAGYIRYFIWQRRALAAARGSLPRSTLLITSHGGASRAGAICGSLTSPSSSAQWAGDRSPHRLFVDTSAVAGGWRLCATSSQDAWCLGVGGCVACCARQRACW